MSVNCFTGINCKAALPNPLSCVCGVESNNFLWNVEIESVRITFYFNAEA